MEGPLHALGATELVAAYARRDLSPVDVLHAVIAQIQRQEPALHALWAFEPEAALAAAHDSETRWTRGEPEGALDGVPATIKENIATRGTPVPLGSAASQLVPAAADAPPAARLREAGAVLLAKTTMPDYGMLSSGLSSFHALARNPWNTAKNPGGSSAGAGAAAAAGYGPLHLGTDIGGSIRLPATWCGIVGLKPSAGRVPIQPPYIGRVAGPMTRSVADAALLMSVLTQPDARDPTRLPHEAIDWTTLPDDARAFLRGRRIGLVLDAGWGLPAERAVVDVVNDAARRFEAAGAIVEPLAGFTTREMADGINLFWRMRSFLDISALPPERQAKVLPYIREWVAEGARFSGAQVFHGHSQMAALRDATIAATERFDFVLSPVASMPAFAAEDASPTNDPHHAMEHIAFTLPFNMSGQPAISVPAGFDDGSLPIGLQISGRLFDDLGVLGAARAWELLRGPLAPCPALRPR